MRVPCVYNLSSITLQHNKSTKRACTGMVHVNGGSSHLEIGQIFVDDSAIPGVGTAGHFYDIHGVYDYCLSKG